VKGILQHWSAVVFATHLASVENVLNTKMKGKTKVQRELNSLQISTETGAPKYH